jgi:hypothetical protein
LPLQKVDGQLVMLEQGYTSCCLLRLALPSYPPELPLVSLNSAGLDSGTSIKLMRHFHSSTDALVMKHQAAIHGALPKWITQPNEAADSDDSVPNR